MLHVCTSHITCIHTLLHRCNHRTTQHAAKHCNTLQYSKHTATHGNTRKHTATHGNTQQHAATRCNMLQHAATCCNTRTPWVALQTHRITDMDQSYYTYKRAMSHVQICLVTHVSEPCHAYERISNTMSHETTI